MENVDHLVSNNLNKEHQSAYRTFHSNETALLNVQNDILQSLDQNNVTILVMFDLSTGYDTIDHNTLRHHLEHLCGLKSKSLDNYVPN